VEITKPSTFNYLASQGAEVNPETPHAAGQQDTSGHNPVADAGTAVPPDGTPVTPSKNLPPNSAIPASIALQLMQASTGSAQPRQNDNRGERAGGGQQAPAQSRFNLDGAIADASDVLGTGVVSDAGPGSPVLRVEVSGTYWKPDYQLGDGTRVYRPRAEYADTDLSRKIFNLPLDSHPPSIPGYAIFEVQRHPQLSVQDVVYRPASALAEPPLDSVGKTAIGIASTPASNDGAYSYSFNYSAAIGIGMALDHSVATPVPANLVLPRNNGYWTNPARHGNSGWVSTNPSVTAITGGKPVQFKNGMVNFDPWSQGRFNIPNMTGRVRGSGNDLELGRNALRERYGLASDAEAQRWLRERNLTPHHNPNGFSLDLIPSDLHNTARGGIPHTGGASILRDWRVNGTPQQFYRANQIATGARYLGIAGMAYGAYVDGSSLYNQYQISQQTGNYANTATEATRIAGGWAGAWAVGAAGAEFGAGFGTVFGPIGTVVGGIIGGIGGGILGYAGGSYAAPRVAYDIGLLSRPTP